MDDYRSYILTKREKILFFTVVYFLFFVMAYLFYKNVIISAVAGFTGFFLKAEYIKFLSERRRDRMLVQFKDFLYALGASMATGRYITEALEEGEKTVSLIYGDNAELSAELRNINRQIRESRISEEEALKNFAERSGLGDIRDFVEVYSICKTTGGDMQRVIMNTSTVILEKIKLQQEMKTLMLQKQFEGRIVGIIPIIVIIFLNIASPDYLSPLYNTVAGRIIMTISLISFIGAFLWMIKLTEEKER